MKNKKQQQQNTQEPQAIKCVTVGDGTVGKVNNHLKLEIFFINDLVFTIKVCFFYLRLVY